MSLSRAITALSTGDEELGLTHLVAAWRVTPSPVIAELVDRLGARLGQRQQAVAGRNRRDHHMSWIRRAHSGHPPDLGPLLEGLVQSGTVADLCERMTTLERWPRDPRLGSAMAAILRDPPYRSTRGQVFYAAIFRVIERVGDRRVIGPLVDLTLGDRDEDGEETARIERSFGAEMGWWMRDQLERSIRSLKDLGPSPDLTDTQRSQCARIGELLGLPADQPAGRDRALAELLDSIRREPFNDHVRQIYADLLVERDDPRGVFIQLQYRRQQGTLTRAQERRERALLRNHGKEWVGDLLPVLDRSGVVFERGFLSRAVVLARSRRDGLRVVGLDEWATVEEVQLRPASEGFRPFDAILHPAMRSLRCLRYLATEGELLSLLDGDDDRPLETLGIDAVTLAMWGRRGRFKQAHIDALASCRRLPGLRRLEIACPYGPANFEPSPQVLGWLVTAPVAARLEVLYVGSGIRYLDAWMRALGDSPMRRVELDGAVWSVTLTRGPDGRMSHLYATPKPGATAVPGELTRALERMPPGALTRLTIEGDHPELPSVALLAERVAGAELIKKW